jgi:tripartite-type tricarboxylate transporter receptor subunit TctC
VDLIQSMGTNIASSSPEEFGAFVRDDIARWNKVIEHAGIQRIE